VDVSYALPLSERMPIFEIGHPSAYDEDVRAFSPPSCAAENLTCQLLIAGGGLSGLSAAEAAMRQGLDVIVIEKGVFGKEGASGLNAGQFLTGWVKPVDTMLSELARQGQEKGVRGEQAQLQAQRRVRAFLRRTVEGCQRLAALNHDYNLRASVQHGAAIAGMNDADMAGLKASYDFMEKSNFSAMMSPAQRRRRPFYELLSARAFQKRHGTAEGFYAGGVVDRFGGSFRPRKLLHALARSLQKRGVRFFQNTEAQALDFSDSHMTVFCGNGAAIRANTLFMANAYARHINGDIRERTIFTYNYVVEVDLPPGANVLTSEKVLSDTRDPCFYARRHGTHLYMGYEETAETSPEITRRIARRTLEEGQRVFLALRTLAEHDIRSAWSGAIYYTLDDYPFVERRHGGRVITFAAPSDHGNSLAARVGQLVGGLVAFSILAPRSEDDKRRRRRDEQQLRLFEGFPKGLRLRPGMRYQEAAFPGPGTPRSNE
jgi:gamma-glutamylputrescine oxidase